MKKLIVSLLVFLFVLCVFAGCVRPKNETGPNDPAPVAQLDPTDSATQQTQSDTEEDPDPTVEDKHEEQLDDGLAAGSL